MPVNELKTFIFENYYKRIEFVKKVNVQWISWKKEDFLLLANKLIEKIPDSRDSKEHHQPFIIKKSRKSVKEPEIITYKQEAFENQNIVDINTVNTEHQ